MKDKFLSKQPNFLLYTGNDGKVNIEVFLKDETIWLTQKAMAELFVVKVPAISKHLSNIFESRELQKEATVSILETVQKEGNRQVKRKMEFYNLDTIISVGYCVNSYQATQFRIWAKGTPSPTMATQKLLVGGPFSVCRNPMALDTILAYLGIGVVVGAPFAVGVVALFTAVLTLYIKTVEEKELLARFGDEYAAYKQHTPFLIPFWRN